MLVFAASKRRAKDGGRVPLEIWALAVTFTALGAAPLAGELGAADGLLGAEREGGGDGGHGDVGTRVRL